MGGVKSEVVIPNGLQGRYVLQWEWDTDENQIWQSCADIEITGGGPAPEPTPEPTPVPTPEPTPAPVSGCTFKIGGTMDTVQNRIETAEAKDEEECCATCSGQGQCTHFTFN